VQNGDPARPGHQNGVADPVSVYLASVSPRSRPTLRSALDAVARAASDDRCDASRISWWRLDERDAEAIRWALAERNSDAGVNKMLAASAAARVRRSRRDPRAAAGGRRRSLGRGELGL
jgi:hypothetical protein